MYDRNLSVPEILILSSNIGAAKIAEIGQERQQHYMKKLGFLDSLTIETHTALFGSNNILWPRYCR